MKTFRKTCAKTGRYVNFSKVGESLRKFWKLYEKFSEKLLKKFARNFEKMLKTLSNIFKLWAAIIRKFEWNLKSSLWECNQLLKKFRKNIKNNPGKFFENGKNSCRYKLNENIKIQFKTIFLRRKK